MDNKKYFEEYLQILYVELLNINESLKLWIHTHNRLDQGKYKNPAPDFFNRVLPALFESVIISLTKIYDSYKYIDRSERNIIRFINFIESNISIFAADNTSSESKKSINKNINALTTRHREIIKDLNPILEILFVLRDKYIAHFDSKYFNNVSQLLKDYKLKVTDIEILINKTENILDDYSILYNKSKMEIHAIGPMDIDNILK